VTFRHLVLGAVGLATAALFLAVAVAVAARGDAGSPRGRFQTTKAFYLDAGQATRTFTFRERSGVILRNRLTVLHGVRATVEGRIPNVAGARVSAGPDRDDPSPSCRREGRFDVCTQGAEWCPMPKATWHFRLVKHSGPAGPVRFEYLVAPPPPKE